MTVWKRMPLTILCVALDAVSVFGAPYLVLYTSYHKTTWPPPGSNIVLLFVCAIVLVAVGELPFLLRVVYLTALNTRRERTIAYYGNVFWVSIFLCTVIQAIIGSSFSTFGEGFAISGISLLGQAGIYKCLFGSLENPPPAVIGRVVSSAAAKRQRIDTVRETQAYNRYLAQIHELATDYEQIKAYEQDVGPFLELVVQLKPELPACDEKLADMKRNVIDSAKRAIEVFTSKRAPLLYDEKHYRRLIQETGEQYKGMFSFGRNRIWIQH